MPLSVRLDAKSELLVDRLARRRRQTKSEVVRDAIAALDLQDRGAIVKQRPYDLMKHLVGCIDSGGAARLSEKTGEKFSRMLKENARASRSRRHRTTGRAA